MVRTEQHAALGRHLLVVELLGFRAFWQESQRREACAVLDLVGRVFAERTLGTVFEFAHWGKYFVLYQKPDGFQSWVFRDLHCVASEIFLELSALGVPVRGAISFGQFKVPKLFAEWGPITGAAFTEADEANKSEKSLGTSILPSAWSRFDAADPGVVGRGACFSSWEVRADRSLRLNPFAGVLEPMDTSTSVEFEDAAEETLVQHALLCIGFVERQLTHFEEAGTLSSVIALKYRATSQFFKDLLIEDFYRLALQASWRCPPIRAELLLDLSQGFPVSHLFMRRRPVGHRTLRVCPYEYSDRSAKPEESRRATARNERC